MSIIREVYAINNSKDATSGLSNVKTSNPKSERAVIKGDSEAIGYFRPLIMITVEHLELGRDVVCNVAKHRVFNI